MAGDEVAPQVRDVHMVLGFGGYRLPIDLLLLHDDDADVEPLRASFDALCEQLRPDAAQCDLRPAFGHWRSFGRPPLAFRPCSARVVLAAMPAAALFGPPAAAPRPRDLQQLINALVRGQADVIGVPRDAVALTPAVSQALQYADVERRVRVTPGTTVRFQLFAEEGVRTAEARWDLNHHPSSFRGGPTGDRIEHRFDRPGSYEVAVEAGGYREWLADRSPAGIDNTVIRGHIAIEVRGEDRDEALVLDEFVAAVEEIEVDDEAEEA